MSIVVPAFNEAARLPALLDSLQRHVDPATTEIVVVDDGSNDDTVDVARTRGAWARHLVVLEHRVNRGKGAAVRTGVMSARGEIIAFVDADNATDLDALRPMSEAIQGRVGAVFGSRHAPGAQVTGSPPIRGLMGRVFNHVVKIAAGTAISDTQCGAKVFRASVARLVFAEGSIEGFAFDVEVLRRLMDLDIGVIEYPVHWTYVPGTKIKPLTPVHMLVDIVRLRVWPAKERYDSILCRFEPAVDQVAAPLDPSQVVDVGKPCQVFVPSASDTSVVAIIEALKQAGVTIEGLQSRS